MAEEKHGTTVYLTPRDLAVDAVLYGDLEEHYKALIRDIATQSFCTCVPQVQSCSCRPSINARPDLQAELNSAYDALTRFRAAQDRPPQGAVLAAEAGCLVTPGKSADGALNGPFVRVA